MRKAGVLLSVSSLPSRHGVGDLGKYSYQFVDKLAHAGCSIWQILPLNPLGYGNSPYQPYSSMAGDEIYISLDRLHFEGLLTKRTPSYHVGADRVDYEGVRAFKEKYLREAFSRFVPDEGYEAFAAQAWVYQYAVFLTLKKKNELRCWNTWPAKDKKWILNTQEAPRCSEEDVRYEMFVQYTFYRQWMELKAYANEKGIYIRGCVLGISYPGKISA